MNGKIKVLSLILVMTLCLGLLSGCMATVSQIKINEDGSGTFKMSVGVSKEFMEEMEKMDEDPEHHDAEEYQEFEYNGVKYYGEVQTEPFASLEEYNSLFSDVMSDVNPLNETGSLSTSESQKNNFTLSKDKEGNFSLIITTDENQESELMQEYEGYYTEEEMQELQAMIDSMVIVFEYTFPRPIYQIQGLTDGVKIEGNTLTLDFLKMSNASTVYEFSTNEKLKNTVFFVDVIPNAWYYNAVMKMAEKGIVNGVGNNQFLPNGTLTYSQYCQILARMKGLKTGGTNYWAEGAIKSCVEAGYVENLGDIIPTNWEKPITREAAITGMCKAYQNELEVKNSNITKESIPDMKDVSSNMQDYIVKAYQLGITNGVDGKRTFMPQSTLKRAELCQLFYNLEYKK